MFDNGKLRRSIWFDSSPGDELARSCAWQYFVSCYIRQRGVGRRVVGKAARPLVKPAVTECADGLCYHGVEDGHEFDAIDAERDEVRDLFAQSVESARLGHAGRRMPGEAANVELVDDEFGYRKVERTVVLPVIIVFRNPSAVRKDVIPGAGRAEDGPSAHRAGEGIEENVALVEAVAGMGIERTFHAVAVFDLGRIEIENHHGEDVAHAEFRRERNFRERAPRTFLEKDKRAARGVGGENGKIDPAGDHTRAEGKGMAVAQTEDPVVVRGIVFARGGGRAGPGRIGHFHLMLQPMLGCCGEGADDPDKTASRAFRRSAPSQGTSLPGVLPSSRPW